MKRTLIMVLLCALYWSASQAQRYQNPRYYYRQFNNELIKIQKKDLRYRHAKVREEGRDKVESYRQSVVEQIESSRQEVRNMPPFKKDTMLIMGYTEGLDSLHLAFTELLDSALILERYQYESYPELNKYYLKLSKTEKKIDRAYEVLEEEEEEFAIVNDMRLKRDKEIEKQYELLAQVNKHIRSISLSYYRLDHAMTNFVDTIHKYTNVNLDTFFLPETVDEIRLLAKQEREKASDYEDPELKKGLHKELMSYLKELKGQSKKTLMPIAEQLHTEPFYTNECRDARIDLKFFAEHYDNLARGFLKARMNYIEEYFPE